MSAYCVGMTGGIGSGKSTAAERFLWNGAGVIDTDGIARELTAPGQPVLREIVATFGEHLLTPHGLDRAQLRALVFPDMTQRRKLEKILHPAIWSEARKRLISTIAPYTILVVPLLFETGTYLPLLQRIVVVDCDPARQMKRVMARSGMTQAQAEAILAAQLPREQRVSRADDVIRNDTDIDQLHRQVDALHALYLTHPRPSTAAPVA